MSTTTDYFQQHRGSYIQPGKLSEAERDQVEAQLGSYIKQCKDSIARLQASVPSSTSGVAASQTAYQLGVVWPSRSSDACCSGCHGQSGADCLAARRLWCCLSACRPWARCMTAPDRSGELRSELAAMPMH